MGGNGVQVYWQNEAAAASGSKPYLGTNTLVLHKMISLVPVTNELIQDGFAIGSYLSQVAPERIAYKANEAILYGDGVGKPFGALTSPAAVVQAKDAGQSTATISVANIANMVSRLIVGELGNRSGSPTRTCCRLSERLPSATIRYSCRAYRAAPRRFRHRWPRRRTACSRAARCCCRSTPRPFPARAI